MATVHDVIDDRLQRFIERQHVFFVGTAPTASDGHVNISPKGYKDTFRIVDPRTVAYLDLTGSGAETIAHLRDNGRIVVMFCAFDGAPRIVRLHGRARVLRPSDDQWDELGSLFPPLPGARAIVVVHVSRVSSSCGTAVPEYTFRSERHQLLRSAERKDESELDEYHRLKNSRSIDGLPALDITPPQPLP